MSTLGNSDLTQGTLTGSGTKDVIHTAAAGSKEEMVTITFVNYSGSTITVDLFCNGTADQNRQVGQAVSLATKYFMVVTAMLGPGDDIRAEASAATSIAWTKRVRVIA